MGKMEIFHLRLGMIQTNCYLVTNKETKKLVIVDPGDEAEKVSGFIDREGYVPVAILLTHGHFDHVMAAADLHKKYNIDIYAHEAEKETMENPEINACGMIGRHETYFATKYVKDGDVLDFAGFHFKVLHTPGHTPGGVCYYEEFEHTLFSGDTLFCQSVGRTDFPRGSMSQLVRSIKEKLLVLPDYVDVFPGHEGVTTIGDEKTYNPYF